MGRRVSLGAARAAAQVVVVLVAGLVLLGWVVGERALTAGHPEWAAMRPWPAIGVLVFATGAWALQASAGRVARAVTMTTPVLVAGCAAAAVVRDATGRAYPMLGPDAAGVDARLSTASVVGLLALAVALGFLDRGHETVAQALGILVAVIGLTGLTSYLYGFRADDSGVFLSSMAMPTSLTFLAAGLLVVLLTPDVGLAALLRTETAGGTMVRWLLVPVSLFPAAAAALVLWLAQEDVLGLRAALALTAALATVTALSCLWLVAARLRDLDERRVVAEDAWQATSRALAARAASRDDHPTSGPDARSGGERR